MISDFIKERVAEIETKSEFDEYIQRVELSRASLDQRENVIAYAKRAYPQYDEVDRAPTDEILSNILDGQADISDIAGH